MWKRSGLDDKEHMNSSIKCKIVHPMSGRRAHGRRASDCNVCAYACVCACACACASVYACACASASVYACACACACVYACACACAHRNNPKYRSAQVGIGRVCMRMHTFIVWRPCNFGQCRMLTNLCEAVTCLLSGTHLLKSCWRALSRRWQAQQGPHKHATRHTTEAPSPGMRTCV